MIFTKIFNIIRLNLSLPSYLSKNKFLIERNNKIKNIFSTLNFMFKSSTWSFSNSNSIDFVSSWVSIFKYLVIFMFILFLCINRVDTILINYSVFTFWKSFTITYLILLNIHMYIFFILKKTSEFFLVLNYKNRKYKYFIIKKKRKFYKYEVIKNFQNINTFKSAANSLNNSFVFNKKNFSWVLLIKKSYKAVNLHINELTPFAELVNNRWYSLIEFKNFRDQKLINLFSISNVNYFEHLHQSTFKLDFNFVNLKTYFLKNIEYYKWLYKYSLIHSTSFVEARLLSLKTNPIGTTVNMNNDLYSNSIFNYYFNDTNLFTKLYLNEWSKFKKKPWYLKEKSIKNLFLQQEWLKSFITLSNNFNWYTVRYMLNNEQKFKNITELVSYNKLDNIYLDNNGAKNTHISDIGDLLKIKSKYIFYWKTINLFNNTNYYNNLPQLIYDLKNITFYNDINVLLFITCNEI